MIIALKTAFASIKVKTPFVLLLIILPSISLGAIYKWVDADGKTHYGSKAPETSQVEKLNIKVKQPVISTKHKKEDKKVGKEDIKENGKNNSQPVEPKLSSKEKFRLCNQAKIDLQRTEAKSRIRQRDKDGNVRYLSERERNLRIIASKKDVKEFCR